MSDHDLDLDLEDLISAEDFLDYFGVAYEPAVVQVNRLHILQRFHDYLAGTGAPLGSDAERRASYRESLGRAYADFVASDALTEKVFRVFHRHEPQPASVRLDELTVQVTGAPAL